MGLQLQCLWICWTGSRSVLLVLKRSRRCKRSRSWCKNACCTLKRLRGAIKNRNFRDVEYAMDQKVLLCIRKLRLKLPRMLQDWYMGPFEVLK